jgi:hypothetical protein
MFPPSSGTLVIQSQAAASGSAPVQHASDNVPQCSVHLGEVHDVRLDPNDLGMMGVRAVRTTDSVAWLQAALAALKQDHRLRFVDDAKDAQLVLRIDLVKAYIMTITTQKTSNVVLRVGYSRNGKDLDMQIARGRDTGGNWANGDEEAQGSLNRALVGAVSELDEDIVARCRAPDVAPA